MTICETIGRIEQVSIVKISGPLMCDTFSEVKEYLVDSMTNSGIVIAKMKDVGHIDAPGIGMMIGLHKQALRDQRKILYVEPSNYVGKIIKLTETYRQMRFYYALDKMFEFNTELLPLKQQIEEAYGR